MFNTIRIALARREFNKAKAACRKGPSLYNFARLSRANCKYYKLRYPDAIQPAW